MRALESASCQVHPGERIAVVGPSGSGKSTLLHLLGGIDAPTAGSISWPALGSRQELRPWNIGYVFQQQAFSPSQRAGKHATASAAYGCQTGGRARSGLEDARRYRAGDDRGQAAGGAFGRQVQRVAVARALASNPRLILADEPTGQLDHPTARRLFDVLLSTLEERDTALVVATHDSAIAARMTTVWRVHHGKMEVNDDLRSSRGLLARRPARLVGAVLGVATTITLLSSLGIFLSTSSRTMTARAVSTVPVDWQVQLASGADEGLVRRLSSVHLRLD